MPVEPRPLFDVNSACAAYGLGRLLEPAKPLDHINADGSAPRVWGVATERGTWAIKDLVLSTRASLQLKTMTWNYGPRLTWTNSHLDAQERIHARGIRTTRPVRNPGTGTWVTEVPASTSASLRAVVVQEQVQPPNWELPSSAAAHAAGRSLGTTIAQIHLLSAQPRKAEFGKDKTPYDSYSAVIWRDLKPDNVSIDGRFEATLIDGASMGRQPVENELNEVLVTFDPLHSSDGFRIDFGGRSGHTAFVCAFLDGYLTTFELAGQPTGGLHAFLRHTAKHMLTDPAVGAEAAAYIGLRSRLSLPPRSQDLPGQ